MNIFRSNDDKKRAKAASIAAEDSRVGFRVYHLLNKLDQLQEKKAASGGSANDAIDNQIELIKKKLQDSKYLLLAYMKSKNFPNTTTILMLGGQSSDDMVSSLVNDTATRQVMMSELVYKFYKMDNTKLADEQKESYSKLKANITTHGLELQKNKDKLTVPNITPKDYSDTNEEIKQNKAALHKAKKELEKFEAQYDKASNVFTYRFNKVDKKFQNSRLDPVRYDELKNEITSIELELQKNKDNLASPNITPEAYKDTEKNIKENKSDLYKAKKALKQLEIQYFEANTYGKFQDIYRQAHARRKEIHAQERIVAENERVAMKLKLTKQLKKEHEKDQKKLDQMKNEFKKFEARMPDWEKKYLESMPGESFFSSRIPVDQELLTAVRKQCKPIDDKIKVADANIAKLQIEYKEYPGDREEILQEIASHEADRLELIDQKYKVFDDFFGKMAANFSNRYNAKAAEADTKLINKIQNAELGENRKHFHSCTSQRAEAILTDDPDLKFIIHPSGRNDGAWRVSRIAQNGEIEHLKIPANVVEKLAQSQGNLVDDINKIIELPFAVPSRQPAPIATTTTVASPLQYQGVVGSQANAATAASTASAVTRPLAISANAVHKPPLPVARPGSPASGVSPQPGVTIGYSHLPATAASAANVDAAFASLLNVGAKPASPSPVASPPRPGASQSVLPPNITGGDMGTVYAPMKGKSTSSPKLGNAAIDQSGEYGVLTVRPPTPSATGSISPSPQPSAIPDGLVFQSIPGDGNCLFNAVALHVGQDQQQLRDAVAQTIIDNSGEFVPFMAANQTPQNYAKNIQQNKEWGDHIEIKALEHYLGRKIVIIQPGHQPILPDVDLLKEPIFVYFDRKKEHYDALLMAVDSNGNQKIAGQQILQNLKNQQAQKSGTYPPPNSATNLARAVGAPGIAGTDAVTSTTPAKKSLPTIPIIPRK